eukprot:g17104.t1
MAEAGAAHPATDEASGNCRPPLTKEARELLESLDTGDLVLFDRPCLKMGGFFGAAVCAAAKVMSGSPFDHVGVVVKDENGLNTMVEASFSGVAVRPLCERVRRSSASQICVRRLQAHRTEEMRAEARRFVAEVADLPYKEGGDGMLQMVAAAFRFHPAKEQRRRCHAESVALSTSIAGLEKELTAHQEAGDPTQDVIKERLRRAITRRRKALLYLDAATPSTPDSPKAQRAPPSATAAAAAQVAPGAVGAAAPAETARTLTRPHADKHQHGGSPSPPSPSSLSTTSSSSSSSSSGPAPPPILPPPYYEGGMFCSELVAALYQRLGLLDAPFPARHDYVPADFAQSLGNPTGCLGVDTREDATMEGGVDAKVTAANSRDNRTTGTSQVEALPPSIPEGGGRIALLGGAALSPGCWLRGGPPSPSPPGRKERGAEGEQGPSSNREGGGGGGGRGSMPSGAAPTGTGTGPNSKLHFSRRASVAPSAAAAAAAAAALERVGAGEDGKLGALRTATAAAAASTVTAAAAWAVLSRSKRKVSKPIVFGRYGPLAMLAGSGAVFFTAEWLPEGQYAPARASACKATDPNPP